MAVHNGFAGERIICANIHVRTPMNPEEPHWLWFHSYIIDALLYRKEKGANGALR
jgi:hypothetical protein